MATHWPLRSKASLVDQFVGKTLHEIPLPAAVLDIAKIKQNCARMLEVVDELGCDFMPEVSSHMTTEITRLQFGDNGEEVRVLVTSLWEATKLLPLLLDYQITGAQVNVFYGVPLTPSQVEAAAEISRQLGRRGGNIRFLVDHVAQLDLVEQVGNLSGYAPRIYILVDVGDGFSGLRPGTRDLHELFARVEEIVLRPGSHTLEFVGFYSDIEFPSGPPDFVSHLRLLDRQLTTLLHASLLEAVRIAVHAPPGLCCSLSLAEEPLSRELSKISHTLEAAIQENNAIEIHCGEYVLLGLRSLATNSQEHRSLGYDNMALTILTEISSLYPKRSKNVEALISIGGSAFQTNDGGRCKGIVSSWNLSSSILSEASTITNWEVDRCREDTAVLVWKGENQPTSELEVGKRLRIYPYDTKRSGEVFGWYCVVDSSRGGKEDEIVDIFVRWRG